MNDNDIVNALECLCGIETPCKDCVGHRFPYPVCKQQVAKDARDIINRQKAEIEELQGTLKFVRGTVARLLETSDKQQATIEKLKEAYAVYEETTGLKQVRKDAYRKFAERLKAKRGSHGEIWGNDIDNLVKEMTEE